MNFKERSVVFFTFLVSCLALALLAGGLGTRYWVVAQAVRENSNKSTGFVHFGLFEGTRRLNYGLGERTDPIDVLDVLFRERTFMVKELYIATIGCIAVAMLFGIISAFVAIVNTATNPSEAVCHLPGLIAWNVVASVASFASVMTWIVQYFVKLRANVLLREDVTQGGWNSRGKANIGHSFWLVVVAFALFALNVVIIHSLRLNRRKGGLSNNKRAINVDSSTKPNGNLMLY